MEPQTYLIWDAGDGGKVANLEVEEEFRQFQRQAESADNGPAYEIVNYLMGNKAGAQSILVLCNDKTPIPRSKYVRSFPRIETVPAGFRSELDFEESGVPKVGSAAADMGRNWVEGRHTPSGLKIRLHGRLSGSGQYMNFKTRHEVVVYLWSAVQGLGFEFKYEETEVCIDGRPLYTIYKRPISPRKPKPKYPPIRPRPRNYAICLK